uniref:DUF3778 domain-containing protein n=1 Tax=Heterorhabditis bacteriophora TaxID=37862 RepID=A0A1I7WAZ2_HETBA
MLTTVGHFGPQRNDLRRFVALGTKSDFFSLFLTISIRTIFVIVVFFLPGIGVFLTADEQRLIVLEVELAVHTEVYYLFVAEISLSFGCSANPNSQLHDVDWSREIMKSVWISTYCLVIFFEIKNLGYTGNPYAKFQKRTVVQSISLPIAISDRDIISIARTGSEKTVTDSVLLTRWEYSPCHLNFLNCDHINSVRYNHCCVVHFCFSSWAFFKQLAAVLSPASENARIFIKNYFCLFYLRSTSNTNTRPVDIIVEVMFSHKYPENRLLLYIDKGLDGLANLNFALSEIFHSTITALRLHFNRNCYMHYHQHHYFLNFINSLCLFLYKYCYIIQIFSGADILAVENHYAVLNELTLAGVYTFHRYVVYYKNIITSRSTTIIKFLLFSVARGVKNANFLNSLGDNLPIRFLFVTQINYYV